MIKEIRIQNYKSIVDLTLELGKTNVFIGENGCGKTNILEALAMLSGAKNNRLMVQDLVNKGVRVAKPSLTRSSFLGNGLPKEIIYTTLFEELERKLAELKSELVVDKNADKLMAKWKDTQDDLTNQVIRDLGTLLPKDKYRNFIRSVTIEETTLSDLSFSKFLSNYIIYDLNTPALRGQTPQSFISPMGIHGESLDVAFASFNKREMTRLLKYKYLISWLDEIIIDRNNEIHLDNLRIKGNSQLYFTDKYMKKKALFNSENANEGVLHILFYLTLFIHKETPNIFAIDNIETALNPRVCRELMKVITELNKDKQVLITTHNPAILDGLNLADDDIRLFAVRRNKKGYTVADRIQFKEGAKKEFKLSEMWMKGLLGAVPTNF